MYIMLNIYINTTVLPNFDLISSQDFNFKHVIISRSGKQDPDQFLSSQNKGLLFFNRFSMVRVIQ